MTGVPGGAVPSALEGHLVVQWAHSRAAAQGAGRHFHVLVLEYFGLNFYVCTYCLKKDV